MNTVITQLPLDDLHDSPTNPRQHYTAQGLAELAADIRTHGRVLSPILVRPHIPELFRSGPDAEAAQCGYEIVFGHRRVRAARLAELTHIPAMVQSLSDAEVIAAQVSENLAREDVTAIEEAEGFAQLMRTSKLTADDLAERFGRSRSYVYARLKLLHLTDDVRKAVTAGEIDAEVAQLLGRLRHPKLQDHALAAIKRKALDAADGGRQSYRQIAQLLREDYTTDLKNAIFDTHDAGLVPKATDCKSCPSRSGNDPAWHDVATEKADGYSPAPRGANVCTDPACWKAKTDAHLARTAAALPREDYAQIITGPKAAKIIGPGGMVLGTEYVLAKDVSIRDGVRPACKPTAVVDKYTGQVVQMYRKADVTAAVQAVAALRASVSVAETQAASPPAQAPKAAATDSLLHDAAAESAARTREAERRIALWHRCRGHAAQHARTGEEFRLIVLALIDHAEHHNRIHPQVLIAWGASNEQALADQAGQMNSDTLALLLLDIVTSEGLTPWSVKQSFGAAPFLSLYGLDSDPASTPSTAGAGASMAAACAQAVADAPAGAGAALADGQAEQAPANAAACGGQEQMDEGGQPAACTATALPLDASQPAAQGGQKQMDEAASGGSPGRRAGKGGVPAMYRHPATGETWTGRGLMPAWLRSAMGRGEPLAGFLIPQAGA